MLLFPSLKKSFADLTRLVLYFEPLKPNKHFFFRKKRASFFRNTLYLAKKTFHFEIIEKKKLLTLQPNELYIPAYKNHKKLMEN